MKLDTKEATTETNMSLGKSVDMGISTSGVGQLMYLLSNLYNDPETAVIREYFTNAQDAHVRVGQTKPVEVYLPTRDNPLYVVKDCGVGMSASDIEHIYSQYGESTKRDTNDESGAFGLGCKSALAINSQFTLTSIKDGSKTTALISKSETGINKLDILPSKKTDEETGTTVTIPIRDVTSFNEKAHRFFQYSAPGSVHVNGREPESVFKDTELLDIGVPGVTVHTKHMVTYSYGAPDFKIIMGNVPYEISKRDVEDALRRINVSFDIAQSKLHAFFNVSIGDVDLTPPREGLRYSDKTKARVDEILEAYVRVIRKKAQDEIDAVDNRADVFAAINKWNRIIDSNSPKWRGQPVPDQIRFGGTKVFNTVKRNGADSTHSSASVIDPRQNISIVYNVDVVHYRKVALYLTPYMDTMGYGSRRFYFTNEADTIKDPWLRENSNVEFVDGKELVEIGKAKRKADREAKKKELKPVGGSKKLAYTIMDLNTAELRSVPYDQIAPGTPYMSLLNFSSGVHDFFVGYTNGRKSFNDRYDAPVRLRYATALTHFTQAKEVIIIAPPRQTSALVDRVKDSYSIMNDVNATVKNSFHSVPQPVKDIESLQHSEFRHLISKIKAKGFEKEVKDRDLRRMMNPTKKAKITHQKLSEYKKHLDTLKIGQRDIAIPNHSSAVADLMARYPLIEAISFMKLDNLGTEHLVKYMNTVHDESLTPAP